MIHLPALLLGDFFFLDPEKYHPRAATGYEHLVHEEVHLAQIGVVHLLVAVGCHVRALEDREGLALPVKSVDLIIFTVVERFVWEVFGANFGHVMLHDFLINLVLCMIINKVMMHP